MKESIVIAGATSFIGIHLIKELVKNQKYHITAVVRKNAPKTSQLNKISKEIKIVELELEAYANMDTYLDTCDTYIPLTWAGTNAKDRTNEEVNAKSCKKLFESVICMVERCGCKKVIWPGSFAEYGALEGPMTEDLNCNPNLEYGKYKLAFLRQMEQYCAYKKVQYIEVRLFSIFGPCDLQTKMIYKTIDILKKNKTMDLTLGSQIWDFIYITDVVRAFCIFIENEVPNGSYNIVTMEQRSLKSYLDEIQVILDSKGCLNYGAIVPKEPANNVICDNTKMRNVTGWKPLVSFKEGIKELIQYENKHSE